MSFECPNCHGIGVEKIDDRFFSQERIQGSDDLNADPLSDIRTLVELWYCCFCGRYFRVYYRLEKITSLSENVK